MDYQVGNTRFCQLRGHEENRSSYIFIYKEGQKTQQWLCVDCILQYFDNHGSPKTNHMMKRQLFLDFLKQQSKPIYYQNKEQKKQIPIWIKRLQQLIQSTQLIIQQLQEEMKTIQEPIYNYKQNKESKKQIQICIKKLQQFIQSTSFLIKQLQEEMKTIQEIEEIIKLTQKDHNLLTIEQIDKIINLKNWYQSLSSDLLKQVIQDFDDLQNHSKIKNRKYIIQVIDRTLYRYFGSSISKNEQYLAYGGDNKLLQIYEIQQQKIIKEIKLDVYSIYVCQFTQDSSQLYIGLQGGYAIGYDVQNDFKEIYNQKIHQKDIKNLITIQNEFLITCSHDNSIIKTDIKSKQQIFKLTGHTYCINAIDYNDKDEIIVSGSDDKSVKLWNCKNQRIIINKEQSHNNNIRQIQLINNNQNILSLDQGGNLYKWKIDLTNKDLIKLQQFSDYLKIIFNFYQVNQDKNLLLICNDYAKILNQQGETINTIEHGDNYSWPECDCRQLDNLKYIQIRTQQKILLAIAQE